MGTSQANQDGVYGQEQLASPTGEFNILSFIIARALGRMHTATLAKVVGVTGGGLGPVGTVDVQPLVSMLDGAGQAHPHGTVYKVPFFRLQGGDTAVILDPKVGSIGFLITADSDISRVKKSGAPASPGSARKFDLADSLFIGGWEAFAGTPSRYVLMDGAGIKVVDPAEITVQAPSIKLDGAVEVTGNLTVDQGGSFVNDVTIEDKSFISHKHGGVQTGSGNTGVPI